MLELRGRRWVVIEMTWSEFAQMVTAGAALLAAMTSLRNSRKIDEVHKATNSIVTQLVETTKVEAFAAGQKDEKDKNAQ